VGGTWLYFKTRPQQYRPDERPEDITSSLARRLPPEAPRPKFTDVTSQAGLGAFRTFVGERTSQLPEDVGSGAAWGDFDNDGDDDVLLVSAGGSLRLPDAQLAPTELFENLGNGTFRKVAGFPETRIRGMAASWGDYDADGFLDVAVSGYQTLLLFHNEGGTGKFIVDNRLPNARGCWAGLSWGDYDNDRRPDLYVCGYVHYDSSEADRERGSTQAGEFVPFTLNPASFVGGTNLLFHQNADGSFTDAAAELKVQNPQGRSLGALWHDFDDDGWLDLYVANDVSDNVFYRNVRGKFEDISHAAWVADYRSAMGLAVGDYDRDGDDDLYVTHWVAQENALYDNTWANFNVKPVAADVRRLTNEIRNPKSGSDQSLVTSAATNFPLRFVDVADMKGVGQMALPFVGWGAEFADFDGDGWLDLFVVNGNTLEFPGPIPRRLKHQEPFLLWNQRGEHFYNLAPLLPVLTNQHNSRGLALSDYDNDGDVDALLVHLGEGAQLLRNDMQSEHWLKVRLRSLNARGQPLGFAHGTKVIAHIAGASLRRSVTSVSYLSQSSRTLHFGLGSATKVERLEVRWHAGGTNFFENLDADATYEIVESAGAIRKLSGDARAPLTSSAARPSSHEQGRTARAASEETEPTRLAARGVPPDSATGAPVSDRERLLQFWAKQRAAMNAMKVEKDNAKAIGLFREALALNPKHEDSHYYLGLCLASQDQADAALAQLDELKRINPQSHRAWQQWGVLRATFAKNDADLHAAEQSLERAHALNPEETGALLVLGEVALLRGLHPLADQRFAAACHTNPKAVGGFFFRGYTAWKRGDAESAVRFLEQTRAALGKDWQPKGTTSEGDVKQKQHVENTPLARYWENWSGEMNAAKSFASLDERLSRSHSGGNR